MEERCGESQCAACGRMGEGLKACTACRLVKYCDRKCQADHRPKHKAECKRRAAELFHEKLFKRPSPNPMGDCPICFLPLPRASQGVTYQTCCGKTLCTGCIYYSSFTQTGLELKDIEKRLSKLHCPFCRASPANSLGDYMIRLQKRMDANDYEAYNMMGGLYREGTNGLPLDYEKAVEHWNRAVELGSTYAHNGLGYAYLYGQGVKRNVKKALHHFQLGAIAGHPAIRHNLGCLELDLSDNYLVAAMHLAISAGDGYEPSLKMIKEGYQKGRLAKDVYEQALRDYQKATEELKSATREVMGEVVKRAQAKMAADGG